MSAQEVIDLLGKYLSTRDKGLQTALRFAQAEISTQKALYDELEAATRKTKEETMSYLEEFRPESLPLFQQALPVAARRMRDELEKVRKERDEAIAELHKLKKG